MLDAGPNVATTEIDLPELIRLCAVDSELFCRTFFPRAFHQPSPVFARSVWDLLDDPAKRLVNIQMFRGSSKTTRLRAFTLKRIAYGLSRTVLYTGKSEGHAGRSIRWIKQQVEFNRLFAQVFGLRKGSPWTDTQAQILHGVEDHAIWMLGLGITGSIRGLNLDDHRPDLIVVDDVVDEENSATAEQREKIESLVYGALMGGLVPASEVPDAKLAMLQTPLNREDISTKALADPEWHSMVVGCWTPETAQAAPDQQESIWPERWSSAVLREAKRAAAKRNKLSIWLRENECKVTSPETSSFRAEWLKRWEVLPPMMTTILAIDPVPPPSPIQVAKGMAGKDFEAFAVVGTYGGKFYLREVSQNRGHEPNWTVNEFFRLCVKYRAQRAMVEAVAYQRTLLWILKEAMKREGRYWRVEPFVDGRSKFLRILDSLSGPTSEGALYIPPDGAPEGMNNSEGMQAFVMQFAEHPNVSNDDALEAVAVAVAALQGTLAPEVEVEEDPQDEAFKPLRYAPEALCP